MKDTTSVQAAVTAALNASNDLCYEVKPAVKELTVVPSHSLAKAVLVIDDNDASSGPIQLILPATHVTELDVLNRELSGNFRGLTAEESQPFLGEHQFLASVPGWQGLTCIVHAQLTHQATVSIELGPNGDIAELGTDAFKQLACAHRLLDFARLAPSTNGDIKNDEAAIQDSVKRFTEKRIQQRLADTLDFPPLPRTAMRVLQLKAKGEIDAKELTDIIESDPALAAQVISWASSPYYRAPGEIKSVHDAIVRVLGFDIVLNLALGLALSNGLKFKQISRREMDQYWRESMLLASTAEALVMGIDSDDKPERGVVYLCGLMANLGYLILAEVFPLYFQQVKRQHQVNLHHNLSTIEQHVLGIHNHQVAAWLLDHWQMPKNIVEAVRFSNEYHQESQLANIVLCARQLLAQNKLLAHTNGEQSEALLRLMKIDSKYAEKQIEKMTELTELYAQSVVA